MGKGKSINPIYFFTDLSYETESLEERDPETYLGEYNAEIYYGFEDLKTGKKESGVAFHNIPYFPANIMVAKDAVNLNSNGDGEYEINKDISYDQCLQAISDITARDTSLDDISAEMVRKELQGKQKTV